nr:IS630 family transposase [Bradyrhizobium diazoefficiens]
MGKPYSLHLRKRVFAAIEGGMSPNQAAKQLGVAISTAISWMKRVDETGSVEPSRMGGYKPKAISGEHAGLAVAADQGQRFHHTGARCRACGRGLKVDYHSVWDFVHAEKLSFKKKPGGWRTRSTRGGAAASPVDKGIKGRVEAERLVFIDETWTRTDMAPLRGWAPRGRRLQAKVQTMIFLAALRHDRIDAPGFIERPIDGVSFRTYVEKVLLPILRPAICRLGQPRQPQEQSSSSAHPFGRRQAFFLPKYSPDLDPIEQVFAKLKHLLRKAAARTVDAVCAAIGHALDAFTSEECFNYLNN